MIPGLIRIVVSLALILALGLAAFPARATSYTDKDMYGPGGMGGTVEWGTSYTNNTPLGKHTNTYDYQQTQSFIPLRGTLSSFGVYFGSTVGSPTGTVTWEIRPLNGEKWADSVDAGTFTPSASVLNTITVTDGPYFDGTSHYLLFLRSTAEQTAGNYWQVRYSSSTYNVDGIYGNRFSNVYSTDPYQVINHFPLYGLIGSITTTDDTPNAWLNDKYSQSFTVSLDTTISAVKPMLKKTGTPTGTDTIRIEGTTGLLTNDELISADATCSINEADLSTSYAYATCTLTNPVTLHAGVKYHLTLGTDRESVTDFVSWASIAAVGNAEQLSKHEVLADTWTPIDYYGVYQLVIDSFPLTGETITLPSGQTGTVDYTITAGDAAIALELVILIGLIAFAVLLLLTRRQT